MFLCLGIIPFQNADTQCTGPMKETAKEKEDAVHCRGRFECQVLTLKQVPKSHIS